MKKTLNFSAVLVLALFSLASCKINQEMEDKKKELPGIAGMDSGPERNYTASELQITRRICSNLKKKRESFARLERELQFKFRADLRNCDDSTYNADLFVASISNASPIDLEYVANRSTYFRDVITDQAGIMKQMCDAAIQSDNVSNVILNGNYKYSVKFLIADGYDRYEVIKARKNPRGSYDTLSGEVVSIISQKIQAPAEFFGVEKERVRYTVCEANRYSTIKQTWIEAIK